MTDWQIVPLKNIGTLERGKGLLKSDFNDSGTIPCIHYGQIFTYYGGFTESTISFVTSETARNCTVVNPGDAILAITSENVEDLCKSTVWLGGSDIVTGGHSGVFRHNQNPKFLGYYFQSEYFNRQKAKYAKGTKVIEINPEDILNRIKIKLPDLETQQMIVSVLDNIGSIISITEKKKACNVAISQYLISELISQDDLSTIKRLKNIAIIKKGKQYNKEDMLDSGVPVINGGTEPSGYAECGNMPPDTITISEGGNSCGYIGYQRDAFWLGGHCYAILPNGIDKKELFFILKGHEKKIMRLRVGSGLPNIQKSDLENFKLEIAQEQKRNKISRILEVIDDTNRNLEELLNCKKRQYKYLLNHLINGDLDLSKIQLEEKDKPC